MSEPVNNSNVLFVDTTSLTADDIGNLDVETALLLVQMNRANSLDTQLKAEMTKVQQKNDQIALLTTAMTKLQAVWANIPAGDAPDSTVANNMGEYNAATGAYEMETACNDALSAAGIGPFGANEGHTSAVDPKTGDLVMYTGGISAATKKSQVDAAIKQIDGMIQNLNSTQQMDMLKLQSLSNKRNEAYEIMTNFIKKMQDNKNSIISNMR